MVSCTTPLSAPSPLSQAQLSRKFNEGSNPQAEPIAPATLALLRTFFAPYTAALFRLLGKPIAGWEL